MRPSAPLRTSERLAQLRPPLSLVKSRPQARSALSAPRWLVTLVLDAVVLLLAVSISVELLGAEVQLALGAALTLLLLVLGGEYVHGLPRGLGEQLRNVVARSAIATLVVALAFFLSGGDGSTSVLAPAWAIFVAALATNRAALYAIDLRRWLRGDGGRRVLIVGAGQVSRLAARRFVERPGLGLIPVGFLDLDPMLGDEREPEVLGASWDLERIIEQQGVETVLIGFSRAPHSVLLRIVHRCWELGVEVIVVPRLFEVQGVGTRTRHVGGLPLVALGRRPYPRLWWRAKGIFGRVVAGLLLVFLAPLLAAIAVAVRLSSKGPVLHRSLRVGEHGCHFSMLKFRTMVGNPEQRGHTHATWARESLQTASEELSALAVLPVEAVGEPRTPVGRFLRRTALDELPQLLNVLLGDMYLVGPRPELVCYAELFSEAIYRYDARHRVRPGITGWAQVQGLRGKTSLADRIEWDNFYIENWSPSMDLKILAMTLMALWRHDAN